ncbi:MAG: hypothetical protein R3F56_12415 [Planctomycetota bacterium]
MSDPKQVDSVTIARYVDAEMSSAEQVAFEARLRAEPALAEALAEASALRAVFAVARTEEPPVPCGVMRARVLARLQRGAGTEVASSMDGRVERVARWCVLAAAAVFVAALLFVTGVLRLPDSGQLQADSGAELIRALDAQIQAAENVRRPLGR